MFLKRSVLENGIPFSMVLPVSKYRHNTEEFALTEINNSARQSSVSELSIEEINAEINMARQEK